MNPIKQDNYRIWSHNGHVHIHVDLQCVPPLSCRCAGHDHHRATSTASCNQCAVLCSTSSIDNVQSRRSRLGRHLVWLPVVKVQETRATASPAPRALERVHHRGRRCHRAPSCAFLPREHHILPPSFSSSP
jgi:hypothetical protein